MVTRLAKTHKVSDLTLVWLMQLDAPTKETGPLLAKEAYSNLEHSSPGLAGFERGDTPLSPVTAPPSWPWSSMRRETSASTPGSSRRPTRTRERTSDEEVFGLENESILHKRKSLGLRGGIFIFHCAAVVR